mmetsp:Transcript_46478/g.85164  ORF Transcript_46478/g.85164 Transcript_46478/m.85164 type:complete len:220 (+) Transcript_46478:88-747(+)
MRCAVLALLAIRLASALEAPSYADADARLRAAADKAEAMKQALESAWKQGQLPSRGVERPDLPIVAAATSGSESAQTVETPVHVDADQERVPPEFYPGEKSFDAELIGETNQVTAILDPSESIVKPHAKATALAAQSQESQRQRASRYFATHGLRRVAQALGEDTSHVKVAQNNWRTLLSNADSKGAAAAAPHQEQLSGQPSPWAAVDAIRNSRAKLLG